MYPDQLGGRLWAGWARGGQVNKGQNKWELIEAIKVQMNRKRKHVEIPTSIEEANAPLGPATSKKDDSILLC